MTTPASSPPGLCAVRWCLAEAAPGGTVCAIHRKHPEFKPEELDVKDGHFEVKAEWKPKDCATCDGDGRCYHESQCMQCNAVHDSRHTCGDCEGDGKRETCSICGFQCDAALTDKSAHEAKCWKPAVTVVERPAGEAHA